MGSNPFAGSSSAPLPGGGGTYLDSNVNGQPARHVVLLERLSWKAPGFKAKEGAAIEDYQILWTDAPENHKVGASYSIYIGFDKALAKGNCRQHLAEIQTILLEKPVSVQEITDEKLAAAFGVPGFSLATHDPAILKDNPAGYRGLILTCISIKKQNQAKTGEYTVHRFVTPSAEDLKHLREAGYIE